MKIFFIIGLLFCFKSYGQIIGVEVKPTINQRLGHGASYITGSITVDSLGVLESEIIRRTTDDTIRILYTGIRANGTTCVCLITTDSIGGSFTKWGAVIGQGASGVSRSANCTGAVYYRDTLWAWCANGYAGDVYLYSSTNGGHSFTDEGIVFQRGVTIPSTVGFGNTGVTVDTAGAPKLISSKFKIYAEANEGFHWMTYLLETPHPRGPYTYIQNVSTLRVNGGSYSGGAPTWLDNTYYMMYHYSPNSSSVIPTYLAYATSTDGVNFTQREVSYKNMESYPWGSNQPNELQIADMAIRQIKGRVYHIAEYYRNAAALKSSLWLWSYNGTFYQLVTNTLNCIGCVGVYP